jgi:hypothetical protein
MFFAHKVPVKVAKSIKMPLRAGTKAYNDMIIPYFRQFISGRQTAYLAQSSLGTLFFYKKYDVIVKYYLPSEKDWSKVFVTPSAKNNDFMVHYSNTSESASKILPYHLIGIDYEPYKIIIEKVPLKNSEGFTFNYTDDDIETKVKIVKITINEKVIEVSLTGQVSIGYPLYNNYIPIVNLANKKFIVIILDIASRKVITFVKKWLKTITKTIGDYLEQIKKVDDWRQVNKRIIQGQYGDYRLSGVELEIDKNYSINRCIFYIRNYTLYNAPVVFDVEISIEKETMYYKIIVPKQISITELGISGAASDYIIESQTLKLDLTGKVNIRTIVLYEDMKYAIFKPPSNKAKYYIVNSEGHIEHIIDSYVDCSNAEEPKYLFDVYFAEDFMIILHKSGILLYNTLKGQWWQIEVSNEENKIDFCEHTYEYYYIRKCNKVAFVLLDEEANFDDCIMIDLNLIENSEKNYITRLSESYIRYREVIPYVKSTYGDFYSNTNVTFRDYSLDAKKGVLYVSYRLGNYEIKHIAMECNLCSNTYRWEEFRIDVPLQWGKQHDANTDAPTYISRRHLAMKGMPKYLPMYSMRSLYEVITNKISHHELVIRKKIISIKIVESPYSGLKKRIPIISLCIMDSRFNRNTTLYRKIASFGEWNWYGKIFVMSPYQDIVGIYNLLENQMHNELYMIGIMLINELSIVNEYKQQ